MGFSIWVADDPGIEGRDESEYPYFPASNEAMALLREEMRTQGMLAVMPSSNFVFNDGALVPVDELAAALAVAANQPTTAKDAQARELWTEWLDSCVQPSSAAE